jgi:hypothetical protein
VCGNIFFFKYRQVVNYVIFLQSLWQEHDSGSRLAMVNPYLFGSDIPEAISKPCTDEGNEVSQLTVVMAPHTIMFFSSKQESFVSLYLREKAKGPLA